MSKVQVERCLPSRTALLKLPHSTARGVESFMCLSTRKHTCVPTFRLNYAQKEKKRRQNSKHNQSLLRFRRLLAGRLNAQEPTLRCGTTPGANLHTDPRSFTSHTKHPVSANQPEVLVGPANECVWCQRAVLWPGSPSV